MTFGLIPIGIAAAAGWFLIFRSDGLTQLGTLGLIFVALGGVTIGASVIWSRRSEDTNGAIPGRVWQKALMATASTATSLGEWDEALKLPFLSLMPKLMAAYGDAYWRECCLTIRNKYVFANDMILSRSIRTKLESGKTLREAVIELSKDVIR